ncbi:probable polypeptide N-acetylgalactosaminyltransferase 8 [Onychomys torridus]|uniref:probable polypeptide N-acetylgalactosaminyltransferase 8 n=1 Tax=Onychomys torridus TaxID=38674 RepID=UPI00167FCBA4|nr:probable polypeptide N-acetylgalactosaminyltransferase 8 [Onychomys torridus]
MRLWRRSCSKVLCAVTLVAANILLVAFYTKGTIKSLVEGSLHKEGAAVAQRPLPLKKDVHPSRKSLKLTMKQQSHAGQGNAEVHPGWKGVKARLAPKKFFLRWGKGLSQARQKEAHYLFLKFGYNTFLSNQLPFNRSIPDTRHARCLQKTYPVQLPSLSVILIFMNEALSVIQRAITSIINQTPPRLLKEIILVDDFSSHGELKERLDEAIVLYNQSYPVLLKLIRHTKRRGLAQACNTGLEAATADVVAILDAHIEVNVGWAEPILSRIQEDHTVVVSPVFDNINFNTFELEKQELAVDGFDWKLWCRHDRIPRAWLQLDDVTAPMTSPSIMGILAANRIFLTEIGALDGGMLVYGGENVELSLRVWQCGGKIEVLPCSRIAHLGRYYKPYAMDLDIPLRRNALRVAETWMDKHKYMVYLAWNIPLKNSGIDYGDISSRRALQKKLKCKSFDWYLKNIYPLLKPLPNIVCYGRMKNSLDESVCLDRGPVSGNSPKMKPCRELSEQNVYYLLSGEFYVGELIAKEDINEQYCLTDSGRGEKPTLELCSEASKRGEHIYWDFQQGKSIKNRDTARCLEIKRDPSRTYRLVLENCTQQTWKIQHIGRNWDHS